VEDSDKLSLKKYALAIIAIRRMQKGAAEWREFRGKHEGYVRKVDGSRKEKLMKGKEKAVR
jgi:hypothetical protein